MPALPRRLLTGAALLLVLALAALAWVAKVGVTIDAGRWRGEVAARLSEALGRPVTLTGPIGLTVSLSPSLKAGGLRVSVGSGDLLSVGEVRLAIELLPWLRAGELRVVELAGQDVRLILRRGPDGRGNWEPASMPSRPPASRQGPTNLPAAVVIERILLERVAVEFTGGDGVRHFFDLDSLVAAAPAGGTLSATLRGSVEKRFPYDITVRGGKLSELMSLASSGSAGASSGHGSGPSGPGSGRPAWPLAMSLTFLGSAVQADGTIHRGAEGWQGSFDLGVGTPDLTEFERLLGRPLPRAGAAALAGRLSVTPDRVALNGLAASIGQSSMAGDLTLSLSGPRPRLTGSLAVAALDLRPFLEQDETSAAQTSPSLAQWYRDVGQARLELARLRGIDAELDLSVARWLNLPGDVHDASVKLRLVDGRLQAPLHAVIAGVRLDGDLMVDAAASPPTAELALGARDSLLGELAQLVFGLRGLNGALGGFSMRMAAQGDRVSDLTRSLEIRLVVSRGGLTYGNDAAPGSRPVAFGIDSLVLALPPGQGLSVQADGSLLEQPVSASLASAPLTTLVQGGAPVRINARSRSLQASVQGTLGDPAGEAGTDLKIALSSARIGDVAGWLDGVSAGSQLPLAIDGRVRWRSGRWALEGGSIRVGRSTLSAELAQGGAAQAGLSQAGLAQAGPTQAAARRPGPMTLRLVADTLDLAELESLLPPASPRAVGAPVIDLPILPGRIDLSDTDLQVRIGRITGGALPWSDVRFDAQMRDGRLLASPFAARVLGIGFEGAVAFDARHGQSEAEVWLGADNVDVGAVLRTLKLAEHLEARVGKLVVHGVARGRRLAEVLAGSEFTAEMNAGLLVLHDRNTGAQARMVVDQGLLKAPPGQPVALTLAGVLDDVALQAELTTGRLADLIDTGRKLPFNLEARAAQARLRVIGTLARPFSDGRLEFSLGLDGERLDTLSRLARVSLPSWGPYSVIGRLAVSGSGYEVSNMRVRIGESVLHGQGSLDTRARPAQFDLSLTAPAIQLDDFRLGSWWPFEQKAPAPPLAGAAQVQALRARAADASGQAERLLSREVLSRQNATVLVRVDQVMSGRDRLGNGWLVARVDGGRADIGPVQVDVPGGRASFWLGYAPGVRDVDVYARMEVAGFDYGVLARRIRPESDLQGRLSLSVDLKSRAPTLASVMDHGNGAIEFMVEPRNLGAEVFDLWAANLFSALAARVDPASASRINCGIGRFTLTDGVLTDRGILLDTTRVRVRGAGRVDFRDESIAMRLQPQPKKAQFFSLATPIEVSGVFTDPQIGVNAGDVLATAGRLATSLLWVPLQKLVGRELPADGADVCSFSARTGP
ncbi:MAG TPA: AsmA-like C-terminal region-containing protein [Burkholderiaceae bacterium]|nr:AsmA-like C-terminal region-containing protein [Burkholderiaceae bacterium]